MESEEGFKPEKATIRTVKTRTESRKLQKALTKLREDVHAQCSGELSERKRVNPEMTEEEQRLGVYLEEIEPQVRYAVREFNRKGYPTYSSGFWATTVIIKR